MGTQVSVNPNAPLFKGAWVTKLNERSVLSVRGRDAKALLHNVSSTDLSLFDSEPDRAAVYAGFLSVKGKLMYDGTIAKPKLAAQTDDDTEFWVDVQQDDLPTL